MRPKFGDDHRQKIAEGPLVVLRACHHVAVQPPLSLDGIDERGLSWTTVAVGPTKQTFDVLIRHEFDLHRARVFQP